MDNKRDDDETELPPLVLTWTRLGQYKGKLVWWGISPCEYGWFVMKSEDHETFSVFCMLRTERACRRAINDMCDGKEINYDEEA